MKYQRGRSDRKKGSVAPGRWVAYQPEDRYRYANLTSYTPARLQALFAAANSGDIEQLCICGREILERNWDIIGAMEQRSDALCGVGWEILPGDNTPAASEAAEAFQAELENAGLSGGLIDRPETFGELLGSMLDAVILPFSAAEILWTPGGGIEGFQTVEPHHFSLRNSFAPRLITDEYPDGMDLPPDKFVLHQFRRKPDPARAGKIRVLAWLHCLQNWPIKDLFSFIERFGMPFVVAKVNKQSWDEERDVLKAMIRNFGPEGGGVFQDTTDVQLLAAPNTGSDNVYFHALEFTHNAIYTLLVGQLASSGDASGMSNGTTQDAVRQDILEADARSVETTVRAQIAAPWTRFRFGGGVAVPRLHFKVEPPEDEKATADKKLIQAQTIQTLTTAGYITPEQQIKDIFGLDVRYQAPPAMMPDSGAFSQIAPGAEDVETTADLDKTLNLKQKYDAMGVAIRAGLLTATPEIEAQTRAELGLPAMTPEVQKAWDATGGIRQPITLKTSEAEAVTDALDVKDNSGAFRADPPEAKKTDTLESMLEAWLGPIGRKAGEIAELSDEEFDVALKAHAASGAKPGASDTAELVMAADMARAKNGH